LFNSRGWSIISIALSVKLNSVSQSSGGSKEGESRIGRELADICLGITVISTETGIAGWFVTRAFEGRKMLVGVTARHFFGYKIKCDAGFNKVQNLLSPPLLRALPLYGRPGSLDTQWTTMAKKSGY